MQIHGIVVHIDQIYAGKRPTRVLRVVAKVALAVVLAPAALVVWLMVGMVSSNKGKPTFASEVAVRAAGFWAGRKLVDNSVAVRDVRVQDGAGRQWLVRIFGHLRSGNLNLGDVVTISGVERNGTLRFRDGTNHTIRSRLIGSC
jgi:hypothetical protein